MLKSKEYIKAVYRPYKPFLGSLILSGLANDKNFKAVWGKNSPIHDMILSEGVWYYSTTEIEKTSKIVFNFWRKKSNFLKTKKIFLQREKELIAATNGNFENYCNAFERYMPALLLPWRAEEPVADALHKSLSQHLSEKQTEKIMGELNIPEKDNFYKQEEHNLVTTKDIEAHVKKYVWLYSRYGSEKKYTVEEARKRLSEINKENYLLERRQEKKELSTTIEKAKKIIGRDAFLVDLFQYIIYYRTQRTDVMNKSAFLFIPKLKELARSRGLTHEQLLHCTKEELLKKIPAKEEINKRIRNHAIIIEDRKIYCLSGEEGKKIEKFLSMKIKKVDEFKGAIASPGKMVGKVKKIFGSSDFYKFETGDILVTSMTTPEMVPVMRKAAAFVTDEGGVTCHAAIISREMKKPCVIGTKIATKVLKDGDLVEVDADKGIVRKLK